MSRFTKRLPKDKESVLQRMTSVDFVIIGMEMDRREAEIREYEEKVVNFVKTYGRDKLTEDHETFFKSLYGEQEYTNEQLDLEYEMRSWRMQPSVLKKLYKTAHTLAKKRYKRGERQ